MRGVLAVVLVIVGAAVAFAADIAIPALTGRVVDQAGILGSSEESALTNKLAALEEKTTIQLVVVTLSSLQNRNIEEWGLALGRGWGIGQAGKNNGVLLIVAPKERELRIEVGYGLEGDLPDATADNIIRNVILPRFKGGNMAGGINDGVDAIGKALRGEHLTFSVERSSPTRGSKKAWVPFGMVAWFAMFVFIIYSARKQRQSGRGFGSGHSGSSWSSGSGRSSGGFRGGGGSFGGGGASGRW
jgi:uncharacterized protein